MSLADAFQRGVDAVYKTGGVAATYIDKDGNSSAVTVIVVYDLNTYGDQAEVQKATATVSVRVSEVPAPPRRGEQFTVGAKTYRVVSVQTSDELEHTALVA